MYVGLLSLFISYHSKNKWPMTRVESIYIANKYEVLNFLTSNFKHHPETVLSNDCLLQNTAQTFL